MFSISDLSTSCVPGYWVMIDQCGHFHQRRTIVIFSVQRSNVHFCPEVSHAPQCSGSGLATVGVKKAHAR